MAPGRSQEPHSTPGPSAPSRSGFPRPFEHRVVHQDKLTLDSTYFLPPAIPGASEMTSTLPMTTRHPLSGALLILALLVLLLLASCGDSDAPTGTDTPAGHPTADTSAADAPDAAADDSAGDSKDQAPTTPDATPTPLPDTVTVATPDKPLVSMEIVEDFSEEVANEMLGFADKLRRRDFAAAADWLAPDFVGQALWGLESAGPESLPLDATQTDYLRDSAPTVGRAGFLAALKSVLGPWERVEYAQWKVKGAEFQVGKPRWGRIKYRVTFLGLAEGGGPRSVVAWGYGRQEFRNGKWMLTQFELTSLTEQERAAPLFTDVSASAGVAHAGIRFGQDGNKSFAWNGVAAGDVNGDGLVDLFVPSLPRNFLYLGQSDGGFKEAAAERGVAQPAGGTGAVFFDWDDDGDPDLAVADVGWREQDGELRGNPLRLYQNDGRGSFTERGAAVGFDALCNAYSLSVLDDTLDGKLDVFVSNYGRVADEPNNSWTDASNGMSNILLRNQGGRRFQDATVAAGLTDSRWTYASASADYDLDGDQDIYVANDYARNILWENQGDGGFEDAAEELGVSDLGNGMGTAWGDLDNDGMLDLYVANMSSTAGNRILGRLATKDGRSTKDLLKMAGGNSIFLCVPGEHEGDDEGGDEPTFDRVPPSEGGVGASWAWSPALADLDLDGHLDVFCANGFVTGDTAADT